MKMFIWDGPYDCLWGKSIVYAVAETEAEARTVASKALVSEYGYEPQPRTDIMALGAPTRVLDVPCAEIYEWSE